MFLYAFLPQPKEEMLRSRNISLTDNPTPERSIIRAQVPLEGNNIRAFIWNSGVFNQDLRTNNTPGYEWPKNSGKFAIFSSGLTLGAYLDGQLKVSTASFNGEYSPGYCVNGVFQTNSSFKHYKVKAGDNQFTNQDYANWGLMVPYGAPYKDVNNNGTFEVATDIPGMKDAAETIFICMSDGDPTGHSASEGFSGGTTPMFNEVHMTSWCYNTGGMDDAQFFKWVVINKSTTAWDSTIASLVCDPDLGESSDDYIGCDSSLGLGFCYNADNMDGDGSGTSYGSNPPAVGMMMLNYYGSGAQMNSFVRFGSGGASCETTPLLPAHAYWFMKGYKRDGTPWLNINTVQPTFYAYNHPGWTEAMGKINNCNGAVTGAVVPSTPGDRRFVMSYRAPNIRMNPGDSFSIMTAQVVKRGSSNINSITQLIQGAGVIRTFCQNNFSITPNGIDPVSAELPSRYSLSQNYPNPFNPVTKINFALPVSGNVTLKIYDVLGREVAVLVNENVKAGIYSVDWNAAGIPSGVYFYKLESGEFSEVKKMMVIK